MLSTQCFTTRSIKLLCNIMRLYITRQFILPFSTKIAETWKRFIFLDEYARKCSHKYAGIHQDFGNKKTST